MANRRQPMQKRSRDRIEQILLASADVLTSTGDASELTTTAISDRSGVPVATIYRYFADRMAIIDELIEREEREIHDEIRARIGAEPVMNPRIMLDTIMDAHFQHFLANRKAIVLWFGARQSSRVLERIDRRYEAMGEWLLGGMKRNGMLIEEVPSFGGEVVVWFCDRLFEVMFRRERDAWEQRLMMAEFLDMLASRIERYATPEGLAGTPTDEYLQKAGAYDLYAIAPVGV